MSEVASESEFSERRALLGAGGAAPLQVAGPIRSLRVWRASLRGFVAGAGLVTSLVCFAIGGGILLDTGPEVSAFVLLGLALPCAGLALWGRLTGKETLELGLDPPSDSLVLRRGATRHVLGGLKSFTRAWLCLQEVGTAIGAGDSTLHANWIFLDRSEGEGRVALPERFQDGDSRRVVAALQALLTSRGHEI